jgi:AAA domain
LVTISGCDAKAPQPEISREEQPLPETPEPVQEKPAQKKPHPEADGEVDDDDLDGDTNSDVDDDDLDGDTNSDVDDDDLDERSAEETPQDPELPPLYAHGDPDRRSLKNWLVKHLIPICGHGLLSGQWGAGKTFVVFDLFAALATGHPFLGYTVKRQCGMLLIAAEGADEVRLRLGAVVRTKCGNMIRAPVRWYETGPMLLHKGSVSTVQTFRTRRASTAA